MSQPDDLKFTKEHEWLRLEGDVATIGITEYAQEALGDIVYVELPEVGDEFAMGDVLGVVESVKTTSDVYSPLTGEITAINEDLEGSPELVNQAAFGDGWLVKIQVNNPSDLDALLTAEAYAKLLEEEGH